MKDLTVLLVDNNPLFIQLLSRYLSSEEKVRVITTQSNADNLLEKVIGESPEVILIDLDASLKDSLQIITKLRALLPQSLLIAMTMMDTVYYRKSVLSAGADDLILKVDLGSNFLIYLHTRLVKRRRSRQHVPLAPITGHLIPPY